MREFVKRQQERGDFLHSKVNAARAAVRNGRVRSNEAVEAHFAVLRSPIAHKNPLAGR